jgi:hypothetical protein
MVEVALGIKFPYIVFLWEYTGRFGQVFTESLEELA